MRDKLLLLFLNLCVGFLGISLIRGVYWWLINLFEFRNTLSTMVLCLVITIILLTAFYIWVKKQNIS
jgi:hypothetical protein